MWFVVGMSSGLLLSDQRCANSVWDRHVLDNTGRDGSEHVFAVSCRDSFWHYSSERAGFVCWLPGRQLLSVGLIGCVSVSSGLLLPRQLSAHGLCDRHVLDDAGRDGSEHVLELPGWQVLAHASCDRAGELYDVCVGRLLPTGLVVDERVSRWVLLYQLEHAHGVWDRNILERDRRDGFQYLYQLSCGHIRTRH